MIGGIYCEAGIGTVFDEGLLISVRERMKQIFNSTGKLPKGDTLNEQITNYWYTAISRRMGRVLSSWRPPTNRGYYNRTVDLTRSICLGVYYNGTLKRMYRFTGGHSEKGALEPSDLGTMPSQTTMKRLSWLGRRRHPDPASRAQTFLTQYNLVYKKGFSIVIAATMPYAVRLEKTYRLMVLNSVINRLLADVYEYKKGGGYGVVYGYVFETGGYDNE